MSIIWVKLEVSINWETTLVAIETNSMHKMIFQFYKITLLGIISIHFFSSWHVANDSIKCFLFRYHLTYSYPSATTRVMELLHCCTGLFRLKTRQHFSCKIIIIVYNYIDWRSFEIVTCYYKSDQINFITIKNETFLWDTPIWYII